jgi:hypothetical protein
MLENKCESHPETAWGQLSRAERFTSSVFWPCPDLPLQIHTVRSIHSSIKINLYSGRMPVKHLLLSTKEIRYTLLTAGTAIRREG